MPCATPPSICPAASVGLIDAADLLDGDEVVHPHFPGRRIHRDFRHVDGPRVGAVGIPPILLVVPFHAGRRRIPAGGAQRSEVAHVVFARGLELRSRVFRRQVAGVDEDVPDAERRRFHQLADDHAGSRRDRGPAVGNDRRVGLRRSPRPRSRCRGPLRRSGRRSCWSPGRFRCSPRARARVPDGVPSTTTVDARWTSPDPVNPAPWKNAAKPIPFRTARRSFSRANRSRLRAIVRQRERAIQQRPHVDRFLDGLPDGERVARPDEVAAAEFLRREPHGRRHPVHVALEREQTLGRAEAAERAVRRHVGGDRAAADADVRARVRPPGVNRPAREHDRRQRAVRAAVDREVDVHGRADGRRPTRPCDAPCATDGAWWSPPCLRCGRRSS